MMSKDTFVTVGELADHLNCAVLGDRNKRLYGITLYHESTRDTLTYIPRNKIDIIKDIQAGAILTQASIGLPLHRNYIITRQDPYSHLASVISFLEEKGLYGTHSTDAPHISEGVQISSYVSIGSGTCIASDTILSPGVVIGCNVKIGKHCFIGANTVIGDNVIIEDDVRIGSCCNVGFENFEFYKSANGWIKTPAIGSVHIHHHAHICGNVVIEKGTIGTTQIGSYSQIDNLVQIGHEAKIGAYSHIVACVAIAGWAEIGEHVDVYGQVGIGNHVQVGNGSILMARAGVDKSVAPNTIVSGFPAQDHHTELRFQAFLRRLFQKNTAKGRK